MHGGATVELQAGLAAEDANGRRRLVASRCSACDKTFFPKRKFCGKCGSADGQQEVLLNGKGTLYAFSLIDRKSQYTMIEPPYVQAEIRMPEGVHVFTVMDNCDSKDLRTGMDAEVYWDVIGKDKEGNGIVAYKFKPCAANAN
jgi:hypothetical protein